ncbi:MAG TPA: acyl-CoA reductase [Candidatus Limnocylindria bacterium]|nr:acyl-CoA reductase [Candidatus Limnocylindria bacterium]
MSATLRDLSARRIIGLVADAAERWSDADFPPRVRATAAIAERLGYSVPVVEYALDRIFFGITRTALEASIVSELGSVEALDGVVPRADAPAAWARGVERVAIVSSDTTIGVALVPALFALCAKCTVVVKDRADALVASFLASLADEHPAFAAAAQARAWSGGDDPEEAALLAGADVVVAFGRDEALRAIRAACGTETRFVPFGHRASIGRLTRTEAAALDAPLAESIVRDALLYDGEGCLSLHALFVDADGPTLTRVGELLAAAAERVAVEFPPSRSSAARDAAVASYRNLAAFRAASGRGAVQRGGGATIVVDAPAGDPPPFLPRVLPVIARADDDAVAAYVREHRLPVQALGVARADEAAVALGRRIGAVRVAPLGTLQAPPLGGHHGGAPRIAEFVRWIDQE